MENGVYHSDINKLFESYLKKEDEPQVLVFDIKENKLIRKMDYSKVLFDTNLNIYKKTQKGLEAIDSSLFKGVVTKK